MMARRSSISPARAIGPAFNRLWRSLHKGPFAGHLRFACGGTPGTPKTGFELVERWIVRDTQILPYFPLQTR